MPSPHPETLIATFAPLLEAARDVDLSNPSAAEAVLNERWNVTGPEAKALEKQLIELLEAGEIANRGEPPVRFGRVAKASPETSEQSIDVVDMTGPGPRHRHPNGEIDLCIALEGEPTFDGRPPGWVVYPPDSVHVPTVAGGRMLVVYLLPGGAIEFDSGT